MPRIILVDDPPPPLDQSTILVNISLAFAYTLAKRERSTYISLFCDKPEIESPLASDVKNGEHEMEMLPHEMAPVPILSHQGCRCTTEAIFKDSDVDPKRLFPVRADFAGKHCIDQFDWKKLQSSKIHNADILYLNHKLFTFYRQSRMDNNREAVRRAILLIYWVVVHELANFLHIKLCRNSKDESWIQTFDSSIDYGTALERKVFGGRFLTTRDFTRLAVEWTNGKVYEVDSDSYYEDQFFRCGDHKIEIESLKEISQTTEDKEIWLGMGEINRGCDKLDCKYRP
jgi:hypothetical protein